MPAPRSPWDTLTAGFENYIRLEKNLSANSVEAYLRDVAQLRAFVEAEWGIDPQQVRAEHIEAYLAEVYDKGVAKTTQARNLSGIKNFFHYLALSDHITEIPTQFISGPKPGRHLPGVLSLAQIDAILATIDLSTPQGHRNRAILEVMYSCGLRVSEASGLRLSDIFFEDEILRVTGKGDRQRLVPLSPEARKRIEQYLPQRTLGHIDPKAEDTVFLNNRGRGLSRVMIFNILREAAARAGIGMTISPHTLRHSFATHLLAGGADIRQVQELLGHRSVTTTEIYTHLDRSQLERTVAEHHPLASKGRPRQP